MRPAELTLILGLEGERCTSLLLLRLFLVSLVRVSASAGRRLRFTSSETSTGYVSSRDTVVLRGLLCEGVSLVCLRTVAA